MTTVKYRKSVYCPYCWSKKVDKEFIYTDPMSKKAKMKAEFKCKSCKRKFELK